MKPQARNRRLVVFATAAALFASPALQAPPAVAQAASFGRRVVAGGLNNPAAFTFTPRGRIFYGERGTGEIHIFRPATGSDTLFFRIPNVIADGERGLLGIALHPAFPSTPLVYAYVTRNVNGGPRNQIVRITDQSGHGTGMTVLFSTALSSATNHNGGRIEFGPDGMLYAVVGENANPASSQNLRNPKGKVLRFAPSGRAAPGNPFISSSTRDHRIWSFGLRNSFGFNLDPQTGRLWETENGPECNDELNRIVKGGNFGWGPNETCSGTAPQNTNNSGPAPRILPKRFYTPTIAPTGAAFCQGCDLASAGRLFFGDFNNGNIHRVTLTSSRLGVASQAVVFTHSEGVLSMERGPNGGIYFSDTGAIYRLVRT
jgi:glucose/arabinose dehydrogenase